MTTARLIQIAWTLPSLTVIGLAAHVRIAEILTRREHPADERSWT